MEAAVVHAPASLGIETRATLELIEALSCSNVKTERVQQASPTVNTKRQKNGKAPLLDYHVLVLDHPTAATGKPVQLIGNRASPRQHLRRGHIRRYPEHKVWINAQIIGAAENGVIRKSYDTAKVAKV